MVLLDFIASDNYKYGYYSLLFDKLLLSWEIDSVWMKFSGLFCPRTDCWDLSRLIMTLINYLNLCSVNDFSFSMFKSSAVWTLLNI